MKRSSEQIDILKTSMASLLPENAVEKYQKEMTLTFSTLPKTTASTIPPESSNNKRLKQDQQDCIDNVVLIDAYSSMPFLCVTIRTELQPK